MCEDNKSSCDFTRPLTAQEKTAHPGLRNAQYSLMGWAYVECVKTTPRAIGTGLDLRTALLIQEHLERLVNQFYPHHFFSGPRFSVELRMPTFVRNGNAQVGDMILHPFSTSPVVHHGYETRIDTHIVGQVAEVEGNQIAVFGRTGLVAIIRKPYFVFPADQFDLKAALSELQSRDRLHLEEGHFGSLYGSYHGPSDLRHVLRQYLRPLERVMPSWEEISRIIGYDVAEPMNAPWNHDEMQHFRTAAN